MSTLPILSLLVYDGVIFFIGVAKERGSRRNLLLLCGLFFLSGMPALIYQIIWQRALFAIYGVNSESVVVVVSAFMAGLGLGSLMGGWLSSRYARFSILIFGLLETTIAGFGLASLQIFHWVAARTAGAPLISVVFYSFAVLLVPTICMGATLPLLVQFLVRNDRGVGSAVGVLYFVNTFGSAVACYLCATFLLGNLGQSGSVKFAAGINLLVAASALLMASRRAANNDSFPESDVASSADRQLLPVGLAMVYTALLGFIALGFELIWFRIFVLASSDRAPAFALLLSTFLAGIAAGAFIAGRSTGQKTQIEIAIGTGLAIVIAGGISPYLVPLVAISKERGFVYLLAAPAFFLTAALLGSAFPLLCRLAIPKGPRTGRHVSLLYVANIIGSTAGCLIVGFFLMNYFGLRQVSVALGIAAFIAGGTILFVASRNIALPRTKVIVIPLACLIVIVLAPRFYGRSFERLTFGPEAKSVGQLKYILENRSGVIEVTQNDAVYGTGVYDGFFNVDPNNDVNLIIRAYALSAFHPSPRRLLMIGLSSGSWAQVIANHPQVEALEIIEINSGYVKLISDYPAVRSLLNSPRVQIHIDDGRRWLLSHPQRQFDVIVQNTSFYWRDHTSNLLSSEYLQIIRNHLNPGGVFYYNTTGSDDVIATGLETFPYGLRVQNFLAVSDSPIVVSKKRLVEVLRQYTIDGKTVFDVSGTSAEATLGKYLGLVDSLNAPPVPAGMESCDSMRARIKHAFIITDDNMGLEWKAVPLHPL